MLAGGGFGIEEIPAYAQAGASAFGIGAPLLGADEEDTRRRIAHALELASGRPSGDGRPHEMVREEETR
jgi:hypothetical protein